MKTPIRKNMRTIVFIAVIALLSIIVTSTFVACDDNNDDNNNIYLVEQYETLFEKMMGYGVTAYGWCNITVTYGNEEALGEGSRGYTYMYVESNDDYIICEIFDYETENFAESNIEQIRNNNNILDNDCEWNVFVDGNKIIAETESGIYEDIKSFSGTIPSSVMTPEQETFIKNALGATPDLKDLKGSLASIYLYDDYKAYEDDESITGLQFEYNFWSSTSDYQETYICTFDVNMDIDLDESVIMNGSYDKTENDIRYVYLKIKIESDENEN